MAVPAHIAVFLHNRPARAARTLDTLRHCDLASQSAMTIYCDGPKASDEQDYVDEVRRIASECTGFRHVDIVEHSTHVGRSRLIVESLTELFIQLDQIIVVEDDIDVSPSFLALMNEGLAAYADDERVISVCGYSYAVRAPETFFLPGAHCWGWATWKRGWSLFNGNPMALVEDLMAKDLVFEFDGGGAEPLTQALYDTVLDDNTSWSLCWMATAIVCGKLTLFPGKALVRNADHCKPGSLSAPVFCSDLTDRKIELSGIAVEPDRHVMSELRSALLSWRARDNVRVRLYSLLASLMPMRIEKVIYSRLINRRLHQAARAGDYGRYEALGVNK